jgi:SAM-dependent methyltransferase
MLPLAVDAVGTRGGRVSAVRGSVLDLPFVAGSFAHVVCLNVLNHVDDLDGALVSLGRVLRPGGELLFNYANLRGIYWPAAVMINRRGKAIGQDVPSRWVSPADVQRAMSAAGLAPLGERGHIHAPRSLDRLLGERVLRFANRSVERGLSGRGSFVFVRARFDP